LRPLAMSSLLGCLSTDVAEARLLPYLELCDICRLEALGTKFHRSLLSLCPPWQCARRLLPRFRFGDVLARSPMDLQSRSLVKALRGMQVAQCRGGLWLQSKSQVEALVQAVNRANTTAEDHRKAGGKLAYVFVARFRFPGADAGQLAPPFENVGAASAAVVGGAVAGGVGGDGMGSLPPFLVGLASVISGPLLAANGLRVLSWPGLYPSDPVPLRFGGQGCEAASQQPSRPARRRGRAGRRGPSGSDSGIDLRLAWLRDSILVSLQSKEPRRAANGEAVGSDATPPLGGGGYGTRFCLDLRAVSTDLFLSTRGLVMDVDSGWVKGHGVFSVLKDRLEAARALANGILMVACIRDPLPVPESPSMPSWPSSVHALHLEVSRLQYDWHHSDTM